MQVLFLLLKLMVQLLEIFAAILRLAKLDNVDAVGGDAGREFPDTDADVIIVDPPRAGLAPEVIQQLSKQSARAICIRFL